jgi:hypothetical protein
VIVPEPSVIGLAAGLEACVEIDGEALTTVKHS